MEVSFIEQVLANNHRMDFFITECKSGCTWLNANLYKFDAVAIRKSYTNPRVIIYEIKVSRSDFLRDKIHKSYLQYCNQFYFVCPKGLIRREEITDKRIGLKYVTEEGTIYTVKPSPVAIVDIPADIYQYILYSRLDSDRMPFYSSKKEFLLKWLENKESNKKIGYVVSTKLTEALAAADYKIEEFKKKVADYDICLELLKEHHIYAAPGNMHFKLERMLALLNDEIRNDYVL
jgi:hypothetical protein